MITFPSAKINLGLNVVACRADGYHDIETVMCAVPLADALDVKLMDRRFPSSVACDLLVKDATSGNQEPSTPCPEQENFVVQAYNMIARDYELPRVHAHLIKHIPSQAGLGGGSSDGAAMIRLLDERFRLNMGIAEMERYAARLGSDCPFFITSETAYATGRGELLQPLGEGAANLAGWWLALVKPPVAVSTREAYARITPRRPALCCRDAVSRPVAEWRDLLTNDFEAPAFADHPELAVIKRQLYDMGAVFALMSGSGSTLYGLFGDEPQELADTFPHCFTRTFLME